MCETQFDLENVGRLLQVLLGLEEQWEAKAMVADELGHAPTAALIRLVLASYLDQMRALENGLVNLTQAHALCGLSTRQLSRMLENGNLRDYGRPNAPRIRIGDLPRGGGRGGAPRVTDDVAAAAA
jgi:hypothetical protein